MDLHWRLRSKQLDLNTLKEAGEAVAAGYDGVSVLVEKEDPEFITLFFAVPVGDGDGEKAEIEITVYNLQRDGLVMSLEADAADNNEAWEDGAQIAEELAEQLKATSLEV
jgi:hypothetical protein